MKQKINKLKRHQANLAKKLVEEAEGFIDEYGYDWDGYKARAIGDKTPSFCIWLVDKCYTESIPLDNFKMFGNNAGHIVCYFDEDDFCFSVSFDEGVYSYRAEIKNKEKYNNKLKDFKLERFPLDEIKAEVEIYGNKDETLFYNTHVEVDEDIIKILKILFGG